MKEPSKDTLILNTLLETKMVKTNRQLIRTPFTSYHENDSLLLQFILSEFLLACREIREIQARFNELQKHPPDQPREAILKKLLLCLEHLSGASHDTMRLFSWGQEGGILYKLDSYTALFCKRTAPEGTLEQSLHHSINQYLLLSMQLHDTLYRARTQIVNGKELLEEFRYLKENMIAHSEKCSALLSKAIECFSEDENVLFFLLRHKQEFDEFFNEAYVEQLLKKISRGALADLEKNLLDKYRSRGFIQLLPIIAEKFANL